MTTLTLHLVEGHAYTARFLPGDWRHAWTWVAETIAAERGCRPDDVHCDDDDRVTVGGSPVGMVDNRPTEE